MAVAKINPVLEREKLAPVFVNASDANTMQPLDNVTLQVFDYETNVLVQKITFNESSLVSLSKGDYRFLFTKAGYGAFEKIVAVKKGNQLIEVQALMKDYRIKGKLRFNYVLTVQECPAGHSCAISGQLRFSVASGGIGNVIMEETIPITSFNMTGQVVFELVAGTYWRAASVDSILVTIDGRPAVVGITSSPFPLPVAIMDQTVDVNYNFSIPVYYGF